MIDKIEIKNFKSIVDLKIDLGRVNIIIGANGCGKTNILEAISFASAASQDKLDNEFLFNRGIRVTPAEFMYSAFEDIENEKPGRSAPLREPSPLEIISYLSKHPARERLSPFPLLITSHKVLLFYQLD